MKIEVAVPKNLPKPERFFDRLDYYAYTPEPLSTKGSTIVTRIGQCFSGFKIVRRTMYSNPYVFFRSLGVAFASIFRRGINVVNSDGKKVAIIHTPWSGGYYHWLTESIPRVLFCLNFAEDLKVLLPNRERYSGFVESLRLIGIDDIEYFPDGKNVRLQQALLTTVPRQFGTTDPVYIERLRDLYTKAVHPEGNSRGSAKRRIYVTRNMARGRKVINEHEVISLVKNYGFEVVAFENYTFVEQVKLMASAQALISIHGAALTNMIFMPRGGVVLELVPKKRGVYDFNIVRVSFKHDPCYVRLASALGHQYFVQEGSPVNLKGRTTHMADLIVDTAALREALTSMFV